MSICDCGIPELPTILLVSPPIASHCKGFTAFPTHERLDPMLPLVMRLKRSEIFQRLRSRVIDVVPAPCRTAVTRQPKHRCWLCSPQRLWSFSVLRSMPPHMHLHIYIYGNQSFEQLISHDAKMESRHA